MLLDLFVAVTIESTDHGRVARRAWRHQDKMQRVISALRWLRAFRPKAR